ncbi:MAG TPA: hypothetical protein VFT22_18685 [Kofleriaceae bacterium]|nr:hypothetical protein [Kofleriaceae bacterium]
MTDDTATFETASGPRATVTVETLDAIEPQLVAFVRGAARWLDPWFPQRGRRGPAERGGWTEGDGEGGGEVAITMQQVEELQGGRGVRIIRLSRAPASPASLASPASPGSGGAHEGAIRVLAVGLADHARLELRWNFAASEHGLRGTSAELTVDGARREECVADFRCWFGP